MMTCMTCGWMGLRIRCPYCGGKNTSDERGESDVLIPLLFTMAIIIFIELIKLIFLQMQEAGHL